LNEPNIFEALKMIRSSLAQSSKAFAEQFSLFHDRMRQAIQPYAESLRSFEQQIGPIIAEIGKALQDLPEVTRLGFGTLAKHGWYPDTEMDLPGIMELIQLFERGGSIVADDQLASHFDQRYDAILSSLCAAFPSRAKILTSAFQAHKVGQYELSIPVFLIQADGICLELTKVQLYSKRNDGKTMRVSDAIPTVKIDAFTAALLHPLTHVFPVTFSSEGRKGLADILNRHAILHGESVSYDSRINSCKALSLLAFTAWALSDLKNPGIST
jgi:hypothetical protein